MGGVVVLCSVDASVEFGVDAVEFLTFTRPHFVISVNLHVTDSALTFSFTALITYVVCLTRS